MYTFWLCQPERREVPLAFSEWSEATVAANYARMYRTVHNKNVKRVTRLKNPGRTNQFLWIIRIINRKLGRT
jgi:hypothetical protein